MQIKEYTALWNEMPIVVKDVRLVQAKPGRKAETYQLPTHGFIYMAEGSARMQLDNMDYTVEPFHVLHAGKGMKLTVHPLGDGRHVEYYLLLYRPEPVGGRAATKHLTALADRFGIAYEVRPSSAIQLSEYAREMHAGWESGNELRRYGVRTLFMRFVYEVLRQLHGADRQAFNDDPVDRAIRYINEHYERPLTVDSLASTLGCSPRHLNRLFRKSGIDSSPSGYLLGVRMEKAGELLGQDRWTVQEIAARVGYEDVYNFSRMFKKHTGMSPTVYRQRHAGPNLPSRMSDSSIVKQADSLYIDNYSQKEKDSGGVTMTYNYSRRSAMWMLLLSFSLLLGACSTPTAGNGTSASTEQSASQTVATTEGGRVITHDLGSTEVVGTPSRVVVLEQGFTQTVAALEVKPVGVADDNKPERFPQDTLAYIEGYESVGTRSEPNLEVIRTLKPDLIIADTNRHTNVYEELSAIAPTIAFPNDKANYEQIVASTRAIGQALDKEEQAEALLAEHASNLEQLKESIEPDQSVLIIAPSEEDGHDFEVRTTSSFHGSFLKNAGLNYALEDAETSSQQLTIEQLLAIDPQHILILINEDTDSVLEAQKENLLWNQLQAVQNGQAREVELATWSRQRSIPALNGIMDEAAGYF
ncbi:ABC transporter substrate-binding protein [Saccharibacillus sacchari]|uniref:ABC transporter substrate-binding protein n=1 Tax=Saccharibacillus sacchari TaxID=456493 RepID=A0ACC6PBH2_9BACL